MIQKTPATMFKTWRTRTEKDHDDGHIDLKLDEDSKKNAEAETKRWLPFGGSSHREGRKDLKPRIGSNQHEVVTTT